MHVGIPDSKGDHRMNRRQFGTVAAAAALTLLAAGTAIRTASAGEAAGVMCAGVNECKGTSECKTATHECKGLNGCKGEGWVTKGSAEECRAAGGHVLS
jgi:hypothetical protein